MTFAEDSQIAFLTEKQSARLLSISHRTLQAWRRLGSGPAFVRLGRTIRYRREDVLAWANANRQGAPIPQA
jgi:excisionase family DNA binding protein